MSVFRKISNAVTNLIFICLGISVLIFAILHLMGMRSFVVLSGSMEPSIKTGSLAFVDVGYDFDDVTVGDVIAFEVESGAMITHRVVSIEDGFLETKGDNNDSSDGFTTSKDNFRGVTKISIPWLGYFFSWVRTRRGIIIIVTATIVLLLLDYIIGSSEKENSSSESGQNSDDENQD